MKQTLLLICFCIVHVTFATSQIQKKEYPTLGVLHYRVLLSSEAHEQDYINPLYQNGKIETTSKEILESIGIRYNVAKDEMECKLHSQYCRVHFPEEIKQIKINGNYFCYKKFLMQKDTLSGYLQCVFCGKENIYIRYVKNKHKEQIKSFFLLEQENGIPEKVNSARALVSKKFKDLNQDAIRYVKEKQLSWKNPQDMIQLFSYLESLSKSNVALR